MTRDDIIRMAREAGFDKGLNRFSPFRKCIEDFAELIAAAEREACEKVCEPQSAHDDPLTAFKIADAIRARGKK